MIKKCPTCQSSKFKPYMNSMKCERCGYAWRKKSSDFVTADKL